MQRVEAFFETPSGQRMRRIAVAAAPFGVFVPFLTGWIVLLTAWLGPSIIRNENALLRVTSLQGVHQDPSTKSGILFGEFSSCFQVNGSALQCTPTSLRPDYQSTLDAAVEAGLPKTLLNFLPDHLVQTPAVLVTGMVLMAVALPFLLVAAIAAWAPSLRLKMSLNASNWVWCSGLFCLFWGWLLCLSISLAQENQFSYFADTFTSVARVSRRTNEIEGFQRAVLGSSFTQQWVGYGFVTISLPIVYVQHLMWPEPSDGGSGGYWIGTKA